MSSDNLDDVAEPRAIWGTVYWRDVRAHILDSGRDFAVIDVETTGLFAGRSDRILELAVLRLTRAGDILAEYVTLVNPERDVGPTRIHGITASDVQNAPRFGEIAGDIIEQIRDAVLVAHNVQFDKRFMLAEYGRLGCQFPDIPGICTLGLSYRFLPQLMDRRLVGCCAHCGIPLEQAHSALADFHAVAALFRFYLGRLTAITEHACSTKTELPCPAWTCAWPNLPRCGRTLRREQAQRHRNDERNYIGRMLEKLPIVSTEASTAAYLELLERVLEDRRVSPEESAALLELAQEYGLTRNVALQANSQYLRSLVRVACEDGVLSEAERRDLTEVAEFLACKELLNKMVDEEMRVVRTGIEERVKTGRTESYTEAPTPMADTTPGKSAFAGKTVCFTGESRCSRQGMPLTRSMCEALASNSGLTVTRSVTKALDVLVVADPDTMSGKAGKARRYGTRIIAEPVFWRLLGITVD